MLRQVQSDRSNLAHGWLPFAADSITAVWHSDAARGPSTPSFDHLLGAGKQYPWDHEAEVLRRPEIDHKLEFRRCLHRKFRRVGTAKDAAHVVRCAPELVYGMHAVRHEAPRLGKVSIGVGCRNAKPCGERDDKVTMYAHEIIWHENEAASRFSAKFRDGIFDLGRIVHFRGDGPHLQLCRGLDERTGKKLAAIWHGTRIVHDGNTGELRHHLFQYLEVFACDARVKDGEAGDVAARSRHA